MSRGVEEWGSGEEANIRIIRVCAQKSFSRGRRQETGDRRQEKWELYRR
ncbi:hypothetical protein [Okeania sp. SIO2C2]|nr:hypothetical protein [Okeania sp. SIO2C2]